MCSSVDNFEETNYLLHIHSKRESFLALAAELKFWKTINKKWLASINLSASVIYLRILYYYKDRMNFVLCNDNDNDIWP